MTTQNELVAGFVRTVQKHFKDTRSESKAMSAAIAEDGKGYSAWCDSGKGMSYVAGDKSNLDPVARRALLDLPDLEKLPDNELVGVSLTQIAALSALPPGSAKFYMEADGLRPAVGNSGAYRVENLKCFCMKHRARALLRLALASGKADDLDKARDAITAAVVAAVKLSAKNQT
jgi:hypothetical protein